MEDPFRIVTKTAIRVWICVLLIAFGSIPCRSSAETGVSPQAPKRQTLFDAPLASFMPEPHPVVLRNAERHFTFSIPISKRMDLRGATLYLEATNSVSLIESRSQLVIRLNDHTLAQIALDKKRPRISARIPIPFHLLTPGYNRLTFSAAQHYTEDCEDPASPELWTEIDTFSSWIHLDAELRPNGSPRLSELGALFDPTLWGPRRLAILTHGEPTPDVLAWGSLGAQAVSLRMKHVPLQVDYVRPRPPAASQEDDLQVRFADGSVPDQDAVLVGTVDDLAPYLSPSFANGVEGAYLAVLPLPANPSRVLVIATGRTPEEVTRALTTFCLLTFPYPDSPQCLVQDMEIPALSPHARPDIIHPGQTLCFKDLGLRTQNLEGMYGDAELRFFVPPDLYAPRDPNLQVRLHFAHGAKMREDSVMNVLLNGRFQAAIALDSQDGAHFRDYSLYIPLSSLQPGANTLTFQTALMPLITGRCTAVNTQNLRLTLFEDSVLIMPEAAHLTTLPDLRLFGRTGFPYTASPYGEGMDVLVTENDARTVAAAWTLLAKIAQIHGVPLLKASYRTDGGNLAGMENALVIGPERAIPSLLMDQSPIRLGSVSRTPYPLAVTCSESGTQGWIASLRTYLNNLFTHEPPPLTEPVTSWITTTGAGLGSQGMMTQFRSPSGEDSTVTVFTASDSSVLQDQIYALVHPAVWSRLQDDYVIWHGDEYLVTQRIGPNYQVGHVGTSLSISYALSRHPWMWGLMLGIPALLLAFLTLRLLTLFKRRRHPTITETNEGV